MSKFLVKGWHSITVNDKDSGEDTPIILTGTFPIYSLLKCTAGKLVTVVVLKYVKWFIFLRGSRASEGPGNDLMSPELQSISLKLGGKVKQVDDNLRNYQLYEHIILLPLS